MTRPIESVMAEAQQHLEKTGHLDVPAFLSAYPEHAAELQELLPVMLTLHKEKAWQEASEQSRSFAVGLFHEVSAHPATESESITVGDLFARELARGLSPEEEARRTGLPVSAVEQLTRNHTPLSALNDNRVIKDLATQVAAPFGSLLKEVRRLLSLQSLSGTNAQAVFTRDRETSTEEERKALLEKVRKAAQDSPEDEQP